MTSAKFVDTEFVVGLHDARSLDPEMVGTKAANLAHLVSQGFPVPEGFVITKAACERIIAEPVMPADVWAEVLSHLSALGDRRLAVRSSGLEEDLAEGSYAGQYETVLDVKGPDAVAEAIGRCLASATSAQVRAYRHSDARPQMAVLVQRMVGAEAAGVAFTANPISGDAEVLVSAVKGLGDRLVSGEATPDEWVVRDDHAMCVNSPEGSIDQAQAHGIAQVAKKVETLFGVPQDIEWAIDDAGQVFVLQARPITALPVAPLFEQPSEGFWQKDTSHFPTPLTPFGASIYLPPLSNAFRRPVQEFGLMIDGVEQRSFGGEVYARAVPMGGKDRPAPPAWAIWLAVRLAPPIRRRARAAQTAIASGLAERILDRWEGEWRDAFASEFRELKNVNLTALDDAALLEHLERAKDMLHRGLELHFQLVMPYYLAVYELGEVTHELLGWDIVQALSLVVGTSQASSEPGRELAALAQRLAADPSALKIIDGPGGNLWASLRGSTPWAAEALDEYLERYGHRTLNLDPGEPTWFERPDMVGALLAEQVRAVHSDQGRTSEPDASAHAHAGLASCSKEDQVRFERALDFARRAYGQREDNVVWLDSQPSALLRYTALEAGRRLVDRDVLAHADDSVFLEERELRAALSTATGEDLRQFVGRRKAERAWVIAHPGPPSYGKDPGPPPDMSALPPALRLVNTATIQTLQLMVTPSQSQDGSNTLRGVPASPGRYTGTVRVIRDETEFAKLGHGEVLVAPVTSPPWSVLFLQAGAVVTDGGGVLSHTAVIAREYGIPAVLATGEGTRRLTDGDLVTVDGSNGIVTISRPDPG